MEKMTFFIGGWLRGTGWKGKVVGLYIIIYKSYQHQASEGNPQLYHLESSLERMHKQVPDEGMLLPRFALQNLSIVIS